MKVLVKNIVEYCLPLFLAATVFFIPLSTTLKSIMIPITTLLVLCNPGYWSSLPCLFSQHYNRAAYLLFGVALLACFWSIANYYQELDILKKYSKLLYLPIIALAFSNKKMRILGVHAFLFSMLITCSLSLLKNYHIINYNGPDAGQVFYNHIVTGYMIAFAAYISGLFFIRTQGVNRFIYLSLALLFSSQILFVNTGRTGYVVYLILLAIVLIKHVPKNKTIFGLLIYGTLAAGVILTPNMVASNGLHRILEEVQQYQKDNKNTAVGFRLQFHQYAKSLFITSPWIGHGTGSFSTQFQATNPIPAWGPTLADPHSQYWLIASEFGLLGLAALSYLFLSLLLMSTQLTEMRMLFFGLLISFFCANITDSFLSNTGIGYLFVVFSGLCLGEFIEQRNGSTRTLLSPS